MELLNHMDITLHDLSTPEERYYDTPKTYDEDLEVFPNNPQTRGRAKYGADRRRRNTQRTCTKATGKQKHYLLAFLLSCVHMGFAWAST